MKLNANLGLPKFSKPLKFSAFQIYLNRVTIEYKTINNFHIPINLETSLRSAVYFARRRIP